MSGGEEFVERTQVFAVNMAYALVIWLFSVFIFLPLARFHVSPALNGLLAVVLLVAFTHSFINAARNSGPLFEYVSSKVSTWYMGWRSIDEGERPIVWKRVKKILKIGLILVSYLFFRPLLWTVNPILAGIVFILTLLLIIRTLLP